jgi:hypothetical protein
MPLQDHFHPPLAPHRHWHSFHNAWATFIASDLNRVLPEGWFAEPNVQFGIEIDVAAFDEREEKDTVTSPPLSVWRPPSPVQTIPFPLVTDSVEVNIYDGTAGPILAGVIELLSLANKDRPSSREVFVSKCETYLQQGAGLIMVDIVTERSGNLHRELLARLNAVTSLNSNLYTAAYHLIEEGGQPALQIWEEALAIGSPLPAMPLWLKGGLCLPVDLDATCQRTCLEQRIKFNGA